jgi:hypothetical protein
MSTSHAEKAVAVWFWRGVIILPVRLHVNGPAAFADPLPTAKSKTTLIIGKSVLASRNFSGMNSGMSRLENIDSSFFMMACAGFRLDSESGWFGRILFSFLFSEVFIWIGRVQDPSVGFSSSSCPKFVFILS